MISSAGTTYLSCASPIANRQTGCRDVGMPGCRNEIKAYTSFAPILRADDNYEIDLQFSVHVEERRERERERERVTRGPDHREA